MTMRLKNCYKIRTQFTHKQCNVVAVVYLPVSGWMWKLWTVRSWCCSEFSVRRKVKTEKKIIDLSRICINIPKLAFKIKIDPDRCPKSDIMLAMHKNRWGKLDFCYPIKFVLFLFNNQWDCVNICFSEDS